jgi:hypothetical protein
MKHGQDDHPSEVLMRSKVVCEPDGVKEQREENLVLVSLERAPEIQVEAVIME